MLRPILFSAAIFITVFSTLHGQQLVLQPNASAGKDASLGYHDNFDTDDDNYGTDQYFKAYCIPGASGGRNSNRALIQFDLSQIPAGMVITSATLELFGTGYINAGLPGHFGDNQAYLTAVNAAWSENTVTWNTEPNLSATQVLLPLSTSSDQDYTIDVTAMVSGMYQNPASNYGFHLQLLNEDPNDAAALTFYSSDASNSSVRPRLTVNYAPENESTDCFTDDMDASLGYHDNFDTDDNNYGTDTYLKAFCVPGASGGQNANRGLLRFDLSSIPVGSDVMSAELELFAAGYINAGLPGHFGNNSAKLYRVSSVWNENTVTWNNQPGTVLSGAAQLTQSLSSTEDYVVDVTTLADFMVQNPSSNFGFLLKLDTEDENDAAALAFYSSDASNAAKHPRLCVTYKASDLSVEAVFTENGPEMLLYPNPATDLLYVQLPEGTTGGTIEVIDADGRMCMTTSYNEGAALAIHSLDQGTYIVRYSNDKQSVALRFIKLQ